MRSIQHLSALIVHKLTVISESSRSDYFIFLIHNILHSVKV